MWQINRHHELKSNYANLEIGSVVSVEHGWVNTFALFPHRTIGGEWVWGSDAYYRRVWVYTGFIDEPETQWGTLWDVLRTGGDDIH